MSDIVIGKAKVIGVEEIYLDPPKQSKSMVVSRLKIEPGGKTDGYTAIEGIMMIPGQLPFGKVYELTLHDAGNVMEGNDRMFKDGE